MWASMGIPLGGVTMNTMNTAHVTFQRLLNQWAAQVEYLVVYPGGVPRM